MNDLFLILILVIIIALVGDNRLVRSVCALAVLLIVAGKKKDTAKPAEKFTVVKEYQKPPVMEYTNETVLNPPLRLLNDRMALQELQRGDKARQIHRGMQKNRVNYMRPWFEEEMEYNDNVDWWNNERTTFNDY